MIELATAKRNSSERATLTLAFFPVGVIAMAAITRNVNVTGFPEQGAPRRTPGPQPKPLRSSQFRLGRILRLRDGAIDLDFALAACGPQRCQNCFACASAYPSNTPNAFSIVSGAATPAHNFSAGLRHSLHDRTKRKRCGARCSVRQRSATALCRSGVPPRLRGAPDCRKLGLNRRPYWRMSAYRAFRSKPLIWKPLADEQCRSAKGQRSSARGCISEDAARNRICAAS